VSRYGRSGRELVGCQPGPKRPQDGQAARVHGFEGQPKRRRDTREHVGLYFKAFNAWATSEMLGQLRFAPRDLLAAIATLGTAPVASSAEGRQAASV